MAQAPTINEKLESESAARDEKAIGIWRDSFDRLLMNKMAVVSMVVVLIMFFFAIFGPYLTPCSRSISSCSCRYI